MTGAVDKTTGLLGGVVLALLAAPAQAAEPFTFVVVGDTQTDGSHTSINFDVVPLLVEDMARHDPLFGLFVGDLIAGANNIAQTKKQWQDFVDTTADFSGTILPIPGNHDVYAGIGVFAAFREMFNWLPSDAHPIGERGGSHLVGSGPVRERLL